MAYTQYYDIECEINAYLEYDSDMFRGKTVLLPCDDPEYSNFTLYFAHHFQALGLKKLISTSYAPESKKYKTPYQPSLFEQDAPPFGPTKTSVRSTVGRIYNCEKGATEHYASSPKTRNSVREIPISTPLLDALRKVRRQQEANIYVVGSGIKPKEPRTYRETFSRLLRRLKIPSIVFHGLRHTFVTRCIESGCDYKTVSVILGHSNVATTLNLYVHHNLDQKKRCLDRLNKFLRLETTSHRDSPE